MEGGVIHHDGISLQRAIDNKWFVRLVMGGHIFLDTPLMNAEQALNAYENITNRVEKEQ